MKQGFTLVEVLAVIAIIGMLSVMIIPGIVDLFNDAVEDSMKVTENEVMDAANLYLEDYCRNPIDEDYRQHCSEDKHDLGTNKVYFCLSPLQGRKMIKEVYYKENTSCKGIVTYEMDGYKYANPHVYLYCGDAYMTEGGDTYKTYANGC